VNAPPDRWIEEETVVAPGLSARASITIDRWGIPHIRAESIDDLFFVQGFNAARDRLWQIDLWRKRGLGLLASDFGPGYLEQDRAARLFLYRGDMAAEWACYGPDSQSVCERFAAGVNAYVDLCEAEPDRLPPEFALMKTRPSKWRAEDVVRIRSHALMRNALSEVVRSNVLASVDPSVDLLRQNLEPARDPLAGAPFSGPLPLECLDLFKLALAAVTFGPERLAAGLEDSARWRKVTPLGDVVRDASGQGSNNWVVHGSRTGTGRPILANDPHRAHAVPSLRYIVHLTCPDFDGVGAGEPALPGIAMGHNGTAAFGLTLFFGHDQEDVYVYETHPENPDRYRYRDGWEAMRIVEETVKMRGAPDTTLRLKFTRHGPVVFEEAGRAIAIRTVWSEPGSAPYFRALASMRSTGFAEFRDHMRKWGVPAVNQVYADVTGDIGWVAVGYSPVRANWDGLLPAPGDGRFEWDGFLDGDQLPFALNPAAGYFGTANEMNVPKDWVLERPIGYEWLEPSRAQRIAAVFAAEEKHWVESSKALQTDVFSMPAARLARLLGALEGRDDDQRKALALLLAWNCELNAASAPAALFEVWWTRRLRPGLLLRLNPDAATRALMGVGDPAGVLNCLEAPSPLLEIPERDALLLTTLGQAFADCRDAMGETPAEWSWGRLHKAFFAHAASTVVDRPPQRLDVGPFDIGGSDSSPMNTHYRPDDFRLTIGASFRMVIDVGAWDNSVCVNTPGQSGDPRSPHYADLAPIWAAGEYIPLLYTQTAVEKAATKRIRLEPIQS
jgi:penicillin amidase